jgi:hypothetical protein
MRRIRSVVLLAVSAGMLCACSKEESEDSAFPRAPSDAIPNRVDLAEVEATIGFDLGSLRSTRQIGSFSITATPVSVASYRRCVAAGVCDRPGWFGALGCDPAGPHADGPTFRDELSDDQASRTPLTCVSPDQAQRYCKWLGARLPSFEQWVLAARGKNVTRFAWGTEPADCERHWRESLDVPACCGETCSADVLGRRPESKSPLGLQDVLVTRGEMLRSTKDSMPPACRSARRGCVVTGLVPGAIDSVIGIPDADPAPEQRRRVPISSFRCVWEGS